jgi:hypothetical protein
MWGNLEASNTRQYGGRQQDKRRGVEGMARGYWAVDNTTKEGMATLSLSCRALGKEVNKKNLKAGEKDISNVLLDLLWDLVMQSKNNIN